MEFHIHEEMKRFTHQKGEIMIVRQPAYWKNHGHTFSTMHVIHVTCIRKYEKDFES